jgi:hypothetical protein
MSDDAGWAIYWLLVGWMFGPVVLALAIALVVTIIAVAHRVVFPVEGAAYMPLPDPPPPLPPPPLTDAELAKKMRQARTMRKRRKRGLA